MDPESAHRLRLVIGRLARHLHTSSTAEGLTPTQGSVLGFVSNHGPVSATEIARAMALNPTMLSRVLNTLESRGFVERRPAPSDNRAVLVSPTRVGRDVHVRLRERGIEAVAVLTERLSQVHQEEIQRALPALEALMLLSNDSLQTT